MYLKSIIKGIIGTAVLFGFYFVVITLISGRQFALEQFSAFWYFVVSLAVGFGIQIGLYSYLRSAIHQNASKGALVFSGTTSTVAMISCCAHYLANILPIIGVAGAISLVAQYQIQLFWFGLAANLAGIGYIASKIIKFSKNHAKY